MFHRSPGSVRTRGPNIWSLSQLLHACRHGVQLRTPDGNLVPFRVEKDPQSLRHRFRAAWLVFKGKADAVVWPEGQ